MSLYLCMRYIVLSCLMGMYARNEKLMFILVIRNIVIHDCASLEKFTLSHTHAHSHTDTLGLARFKSLVAGNHLRRYGQERVVLELRTRTILSWNIAIYNATTRYNAHIRFVIKISSINRGILTACALCFI